MLTQDQCYSVSMFKKAYRNIIYPCKDITEWEKMNGPQIHPPDYKKHVGRPCKSRRKGAEEIICSNGGRKMSRHGVICTVVTVVRLTTILRVANI